MDAILRYGLRVRQDLILVLILVWISVSILVRRAEVASLTAGADSSSRSLLARRLLQAPKLLRREAEETGEVVIEIPVIRISQAVGHLPHLFMWN